MATGILTTGDLTVTVSGTSRQMHMKEHVVNVAVASGLYPTSGIPMPANIANLNFQHRFDGHELIDPDESSAHQLKLNRETNRLHVFKTQLTSGTGQSLIEASSGTGIPALDVYLRSRGY